MRKIITWGTKGVSEIITLEIKVRILETQVETLLGMVSMIDHQIEIKETGKIERGIGIITVVFMCPHAIETGQVVVPADLSWKI